MNHVVCVQRMPDKDVGCWVARVTERQRSDEGDVLVMVIAAMVGALERNLETVR